MAKILDVAAFILEEHGAMSAMKLQKLVYYCQAWSLVWDDKPLFNEEIEAWANGPVAPALYNYHRRLFTVNKGQIPGDPSAIKDEERDTVLEVLRFYGDKSAQWLSDLTHRERPWIDAREGLRPDERGDRVITHAALAEYYGGLTAQQ